MMLSAAELGWASDPEVGGGSSYRRICGCIKELAPLAKAGGRIGRQGGIGLAINAAFTAAFRLVALSKNR
jgi:hypothetical protein